MPLPDLLDRLGRSLDATQTEQVPLFLGDASALIRDVAGDDFEDTAPPASLIPVIVSMVLRALDNPHGHSSETQGNWGWQGGAPVYLTAREERIVRRATGRGALRAVDLAGEAPWPTQLADPVWHGDLL